MNVLWPSVPQAHLGGGGGGGSHGLELLRIWGWVSGRGGVSEEMPAPVLVCSGPCLGERCAEDGWQGKGRAEQACGGALRGGA